MRSRNSAALQTVDNNRGRSGHHEAATTAPAMVAARLRIRGHPETQGIRLREGRRAQTLCPIRLRRQRAVR
jgi:hypothetical protein